MEPDLVSIVSENAPRMQANEDAARLVVWGLGVFEDRDLDKNDPAHWREMLAKARHFVQDGAGGDTERAFTYEGGPGYVAAVCVRDRWSELTAEEREWCRGFLLAKVGTEKDTDNSLLQGARFAMASSRAAAYVLPLLLDDADAATLQRVRLAIACAFTHAIGEVREYAAMGVSRYLWQRDTKLASACVAGLLDLAQLERVSYGKWNRMSWESRGKLSTMVQPFVPNLRAQIASGKPLAASGCFRFSLKDAFSGDVLPLICTIFSQQHDMPEAHAVMRQVAGCFAHVWKLRRHGDDRRNHDAESNIERQYAKFIVNCAPASALHLWEPIAKAIPLQADEVADAFKALVYAEDASNRGDAFWMLWQETVWRGFQQERIWSLDHRQKRPVLLVLARTKPR